MKVFGRYCVGLRFLFVSWRWIWSSVVVMLLRRALQWARMAPEGSLGGLLLGCRPVSTSGGCFAQKRGGGDGSKDGEGDAEGKPTRGKREIISDEEVETEPCIVCQRAVIVGFVCVSRRDGSVM